MSGQEHLIEQAGHPLSEATTDLRPTETVSVVVLAPDETGLLAEFLRAVPAWVRDVTIIHDGRYDAGAFDVARMLLSTAEIIDRATPNPVEELPSALDTCEGDVVVVIEDLASTDPSEIAAFVGAIIAGADLAKPSRFLSGGSAAPAPVLHRIGWRRLVRKVNRRLAGDCTDLGGRLFAARRSALEAVLVADPRATECHLALALELRAIQEGLRVTEVASVERAVSSTKTLRAARQEIAAAVQTLRATPLSV